MWHGKHFYLPLWSFFFFLLTGKFEVWICIQREPVLSAFFNLLNTHSHTHLLVTYCNNLLTKHSSCSSPGHCCKHSEKEASLYAVTTSWQSCHFSWWCLSSLPFLISQQQQRIKEETLKWKHVDYLLRQSLSGIVHISVCSKDSRSCLVLPAATTVQKPRSPCILYFQSTSEQR